MNTVPVAPELHPEPPEADTNPVKSLSVVPERARVMARTVRDAFRRALRGLLLRDGGTSAEVDREITCLRELLR